jgi:hypothetical protein
MWQKCPICNGKGIIPLYGATVINTTCTCPTCKGHKIISCDTGLPPYGPVTRYAPIGCQLSLKTVFETDCTPKNTPNEHS